MRPAEGERHAVLLRQRAIAGVTVDLHDACGAGKMHERLRKAISISSWSRSLAPPSRLSPSLPSARRSAHFERALRGERAGSYEKPTARSPCSALLRWRLRSHRACRSAFALNYLPYIGSLIVTVFPALFAFVRLLAGRGHRVLRSRRDSVRHWKLSRAAHFGFGVGDFADRRDVHCRSLDFLVGLPGAFIGVPLAIAFLTLCAQFPSTQWIATMFSGAPQTQTAAPSPKPTEIS